MNDERPTLADEDIELVEALGVWVAAGATALLAALAFLVCALLGG